jgi:hypothetical protein
MRIGNLKVKRRVWIGALIAVAVTGAWGLWTRARRQVAAVAAPGRAPFVRLAGTGTGGGDRVMRERAELYDPTPLFFPTEWNFGQQPLPASLRRQPGQVFGSFEANYTFPEQNLKAYGTEELAVPEKLSDVLAQGNEDPFAGMGQVDVQRPALANRSGFLEVKGLAGGNTVIAEALGGLSLPRPDFGPLEYLVAVSSAGIVGEPILNIDSSWGEVDEKVDAFFRSYLVKTFRLGERLSPGRYRVLVGP